MPWILALFCTYTPRPPMLFAAREHGALLIMPPPFLGCQTKAELKGFLLRDSVLPPAFFSDSERTIASYETNDTPPESP